MAKFMAIVLGGQTKAISQSPFFVLLFPFRAPAPAGASNRRLRELHIQLLHGVDRFEFGGFLVGGVGFIEPFVAK